MKQKAGATRVVQKIIYALSERFPINDGVASNGTSTAKNSRVFNGLCDIAQKISYTGNAQYPYQLDAFTGSAAMVCDPR